MHRGVLLVVALFLSSTLVPAAAAATTEPRVTPCAAVVPMNEAEFWTIIEKSRSTYQGIQVRLLEEALSELKPTSIQSFEMTFIAMMAKSYTWDLWGAAYVINGGSSDDGFDYFRYWLIAQGRQVFESALNSPDDLADVIAYPSLNSLRFEAIREVAEKVWQVKTGKDIDVFMCGMNTRYPQEPVGKPFKDEREHLSKRYPKLWRRFGELPLF